LGLSITETKNGLMVKDIVSRGLAARSGMQRGDLLVAVDGVPVATHEEFQCQLRGKVAFDIEVYDGSTQQYLKRRVNG
jgi:S1-C subfamily serine protease